MSYIYKYYHSRNLLNFLLTFFILSSCSSDPSKKIKKENVQTAVERISTSFDYPSIEFEKTNHDFGQINDGDIVETTFSFKNTGKSDLVISNASGSCGCTVPDYPRDVPIKPEAPNICIVLIATIKEFIIYY